MHANIWIRKEDIDKWKSIENKAEFISQALNPKVGVGVNIQESPKIKKDKIKICKKGHLFKGDKCMQKDCV